MKNIIKLVTVPRAFAACVALVALSACADRVVKNDYTFTPPTDEQGQACAAACVQAHTSCVDSCETRKYKCDKFERKAVEGDDIVHPGHDPECSVVVCKNHCADSVSSCYTGCGGEVTKQTNVSRMDATDPADFQ